MTKHILIYKINRNIILILKPGMEYMILLRTEKYHRIDTLKRVPVHF